MVDYRLAIELLVPNAEYGWLAVDADNVLGAYEWIDWRDKRAMPTKEEMETAWNTYVSKNGTPEQQEAQKQLLIQRLKTSPNQEIRDFAELLLPQ